MKKTIFFAILFFLFSIIFIESCTGQKNSLEVIKSRQNIIKAEIDLSTNEGLKAFIITDSNTLDSLNRALRLAETINVNEGGSFPIWANIKIFKHKKLAELSVQFSKYHGWWLEVDGKTLRCDYLFQLVKSYSDSYNNK